MSYSYRQRKKAIKTEKKKRGVKIIPKVDFCLMQANWRSKIDGPPIGTLADLMGGKIK